LGPAATLTDTDHTTPHKAPPCPSPLFAPTSLSSSPKWTAPKKRAVPTQLPCLIADGFRGAPHGSDAPLTKVYEDCSVREVGAFYSGVAFVTRSVGSAWCLVSGTRGEWASPPAAAGASV